MLAKTVVQSTSMLTDPTPSRASSLPQGLHQRSPTNRSFVHISRPRPTVFFCVLLYGFLLTRTFRSNRRGTYMDADNGSLLHKLVAPPMDEGIAKTDFKTALQRMGLTSVFDILHLGKTQFAQALARHCDADAGQAYDNASSHARQISRLYLEHQLSSSDTKPRVRRSLDSDSTSGPISYQALFQENRDQFCKDGDIAAIDSPVAYLRALYLFARQLENSSTHPRKILLEKRRPDLDTLMLDPHSALVARPMLNIVNDTLCSHIEASLDDGTTVHQALADAHYPFSLPYDLHHHQCLLGLGAGKPALGEVNYRISLKLPFCQDGSTYGHVSQSPVEAQKLLSGLSPAQQALLLAPLASGSDFEALKKAYGTQDVGRLGDFTFFKERTGLSTEQVEQLLGHGRYRPRSSTHIPPSTRNRQSPAYINGPDTSSPALVLETQTARQGFSHKSYERFDRMQRMVRLQQWTGIPFAELDTLLINSMHSEGNTLMTLSANTLRALGVYQYMKRRRGITPEEFASLMSDMPTCASAERVSLYDQVFNRSGLLQSPAWGKQATGLDTADFKTLSYLGAGLGLALTEDALLLLVKQTKKYLPLKNDLPTISSLYRQARIARMFGLSPLECTELARLLGGDTFCRALVTGALDTAHPDILDVLMAMDWAVDWLKQNHLDVLQWCRLFESIGPDLPLNQKLEERLAVLREHARSTSDYQRLVGTLLHDSADVSAEYLPSVMKMAGTNAKDMVEAIIATVDKTPPLLAHVLRTAQACQKLHLSSSTLQVLMDHPTWLASNSSGTLTPQTLYLLERFNHCARHQAQSEENLLHYLQLANQDLPQHSAGTVNGLLAHLLGWSPEQVGCLTALLTPKRATTMQAVDWVMRCQACCLSTGLSASQLLMAATLNNDSLTQAWKIVGEGLIAACH
ncbi:Tc toxin subunit A [Pseudomonas sp. P9_35]|uniref:Tc toxin subunit A n=1 Tax=Pseudomonas sp. P9_35 TaxID=3043450 RepID=UPI002A4E203E|nr:Tc toxin subunit A [Pseudomonas sp. P9_35]WPN70063.1 Tc toxin subunit A [Pseudomonas sp. P9_35]